MRSTLLSAALAAAMLAGPAFAQSSYSQTTTTTAPAPAPVDQTTTRSMSESTTDGTVTKSWSKDTTGGVTDDAVTKSKTVKRDADGNVIVEKSVEGPNGSTTSTYSRTNN